MLDPGCYCEGPYRDDQLLLFLPKCQLDLFTATDENFIGSLVRATGPAKHVSEIEQHAMRAHNFFSLEHELFIQSKNVTPRTEQEFYAALGMDWVEPSARR